MLFSLKKLGIFTSLLFFCGVSLAIAGTIERVSIDSLGGESNGASTTPSISADGRYVAFQSDANDLVAGDINIVSDIFVYDRQTDTIERVSIDSLGGESNGASTTPSISADGRYVAFQSDANDLVAGDLNTFTDIFVYDRQTDTIERVSVDDLGVESDEISSQPSISADGRYVSFTSLAGNLVAGDTNFQIDIFVYDRNTDTIERVSVDDLGNEVFGGANSSSLSSDGRYVTFQSSDGALVAGDLNTFTDIFVYDRNTDTIERVSVDDLGNEGNGQSVNPSISADGRYIAFTSEATNLVTGDTNTNPDAFVYDRQTDTIERVSVDDLGNEAPAGSGGGSTGGMSSDGRYVVISSQYTFELEDSGLLADIYVYDRTDDEISLVGISNTSGNGESYTSGIVISADGRYVAFQSEATNFIASDGNATTDVFVYDTFNSSPTDMALTPQSVPENQPSGTSVGTLSVTDAQATDVHAYTLACTVPGADDASFSISGASLLTAASFDFESDASYSICIRTTDSESGTYDENFTITITDVGEGGSGSGPSDPPTPIPGCTDQDATNYNSSATVDNDSCEYTPGAIPGCTDGTANNYSSSATVDDGTCDYDVNPPVDPGDPPQVSGCTNSGALNYNSSATVDDGTCDFTAPLAYGCVDVGATNFNASANTDDGTCEYAGDQDTDIFGESLGGTSGVIKKIPEEILTGVSVIGIVGPGILLNFLQPGLLLAFLSLPMRLWNLIPVLMGYRRKKRPWGTVYDSVTKQPLDPVYVTLKTASGAEEGTSITDLDGRYGFLAEAGSYTISANKDNYVFPSAKLAGKTEDDLYDNLYFGGPVELAEKEGIIYKNIPMDAINFNWNEFAKAENKKLMKFYSKRDLFFARTANTLFVAGFVSSFALFAINNSTLNSIVLGLYVLILILRFFGIKPKQSGRAYDTDGTPLSFGILRLFSAELGREVSHTVIGKTGRYYMLAPNGHYYMKVSKKTGEDSYKEVLTTEAFRVRGGYVHEKLSV